MPARLPGLTATQCRLTERHCVALIRHSSVEALTHGGSETHGGTTLARAERSDDRRKAQSGAQRSDGLSTGGVERSGGGGAYKGM